MTSMDISLDGNELTAEASTGNKQWVAVITDTHPDYNYERDFVAYQKPKTSHRDSGRTNLEEGAVIESVRYTHSGKNNSRWYYQFYDGELHEIDENDVRKALEEVIVNESSDSSQQSPQSSTVSDDSARLVTDGGVDMDYTDADWDGRIGDKMQSAIRKIASGVQPSMHQLAIAVGPHGSTDYGYRTVHRCLKRDLIALDDDHPKAASNGRGAVVLTAKGRAYHQHITNGEVT